MKRMLYLTAVILCALLTIQPGCRDPNEDRPPDDTLSPPPAAPVPLEPPDNFVTMTTGTNYYVTIDWDSVDGAEAYVVEITYEADDPLYYQVDSTGLRYCIYIAGMLGHYRWRVCAGSSSWQGGYTLYSPVRCFEARAQPDGPVLVYPPDGVVFYLDSATAEMSFRWDPVQDESFYELEVYLGGDLVESATTSYANYSIAVMKSGTYTWHVRANSPRWQYPGKWSSLYTFTVIFNKRGR